MSASFSVTSSTAVYEVVVAAGSFPDSIPSHLSQLMIVDDFFQPLAGRFPPQSIFLPATEREKSLERVPSLIERMRACGVNRSTPLVAVGGGVVQDISAFVASIYMRGLGWSYVPTTVLAMVDSCIGGKSSINVGPYKNLAGTFHPPSQIYIDPTLAGTLPRDQFAGGLVEAAKICFCRSVTAFESYLAQDPSPEMSPAALENVILTSLAAKKHFIEVDEFDQKERLLLNFGHTFGHAIEAASNYGISHGVAVGFGILCSLTFQRQRGICFDSVPHVRLLECHLKKLIRETSGLEEKLRALRPTEVIERFVADKKHKTDRFILILVSHAGAVELVSLDRTPEVIRSIDQAVATTIESCT